MKKHFAGVLAILILGMSSWAQGTKDPFDIKKSQEELEIMRGILRTTISFVTQNSQKQASAWRSSNIDAFYLAGQGAVFVIPASDFSIVTPFGSLNIEDLTEVKRAEAYSRLLQEAAKPGASPAPPSPPNPPAPLQPQVNRDELRKKVEESLERTKKSREEEEARREKLLQDLAQVKTYLIEALANYGDSMTTVKPNEYINLVFMTDNSIVYSPFSGRQRRTEVVSAQKSWITDYKAGRLSLENFKQKVLQYSE